jgi:hypothetical protein
VISVLALFALVACSDTPIAPTPEPQLPPLATGSWYLNIADGQSLPAFVAHRLVDGKVEQTFVDSSVLAINANGTWQQTTHLNRALIGLPATEAPIIDVGTWAPTDSGYLFRAAIANRDFVIRSPGADSLRVTQRLAEFAAAGLVVAEFRRVRPPRPLTATWHAISAKGTALPALVESFTVREPGEEPYSWHSIVDSIQLQLTSQRTYAHHVYYSSWVGAPDGPPLARVGSTKRSDTGAWTSSQGQMRLESRYYHQHVLTGAIQSDGTVIMEQGLGPLEDRFTVRFTREQ